MFITFDGIDGVGKSTQIKLLAEWLTEQGHDVLTCRDPGSTPLGEALRDILLSDRIARIDRTSQMLLYMAARAQLVDEVIRPALEQGKTVLSDRFLLSNVVYQGYAGGLPVEDVWTVGRVACQGLLPDLMLVLDMPVQRAATRLQRTLDRLEREGDTVLRQRREGFLAAAAAQPQLILALDADRPIDVLQADIRTAVTRLLEKS